MGYDGKGNNFSLYFLFSFVTRCIYRDLYLSPLPEDPKLEMSLQQYRWSST